MQPMCLSLITLLATLVVFAASAGAQNAATEPSSASTIAAPDTPSANQGPSEFLIEPDAQLKGLTIKQKTYRSGAVGQKKAWDLDIGRFQGGYEQDPNRVFEDTDENNYSGMRLRLPFLGGTKK